MNVDIRHDVLDIVQRQHNVPGYSQNVNSGIPNEVFGLCGLAGSGLVAEELSHRTGRHIVEATSEHEDTSGHKYLWDPDIDEVIDPSAGQFIPPESRVGYESYFFGNFFIGPREILKQACLKGVINTYTMSDPRKSFERIWGKVGIELGQRG